MGSREERRCRLRGGQALLHAPGSTFSYSSGTTNLIAPILADRLGGEEALLTPAQENLFAPLGITGAVPKVDGTGLWKASSFCFCTAEDFARFGLLYLRGGCWEDRPLLEESWVNGARTPTTLTAEEGYGLHWWIDPADPRRFYASGYEGQRVLCDPARDVLALRLGKTPNGEVPRIMAPPSHPRCRVSGAWLLGPRAKRSGADAP